MGTSNVFKGVSASTRRLISTGIGISNGDAFGSFSGANWRGAKTIANRAIENLDSKMFLKIIKHLLLKPGAADAFIGSLAPGLSIFVEVALTIYGIETKSNKVILNARNLIKEFADAYHAMIWIKDFFFEGNYATTPEKSALNNSLIYFIENTFKDYIDNHNNFENFHETTKQEEINKFLSKYIELQVMHYLGYKYEEASINATEINELKNQAFSELLNFVKEDNQYYELTNINLIAKVDKVINRLLEMKL
jgi:hypothetical protein